MFVFPPGGGSNGEPKYVAPGEELHLNGMCNLNSISQLSSAMDVDLGTSVKTECDSIDQGHVISDGKKRYCIDILNVIF